MRQVPGRFQIPPGLFFAIASGFSLMSFCGMHPRNCEAEMINRVRYVIQMSGYVIVFF